jgi:monoamine oxidase
MPESIFAQLHQRFGPRDDGYSRREVLQAGINAGAGLLLSEIACGDQVRRPGKSILVIGGGLGGMAAAYELTRVGYNVTVYEARNRLGGRVASLKNVVSGQTVEGGAEFIGRDHPTWWKYHHQFGLKLDPVPNEPGHRPIVLGGKLLDPRLAHEIFKEMDKAYLSLDKDATHVDADEPWKSPKAEALDKRSVGEWLRGLKMTDDCRLAMTIDLQAEEGVPPDRQSYLGLLAAIKGGGVKKYWTQREKYRCRGGNSQLAEKLCEKIGHDHVRLNSPVTAVTTRESGAHVSFADGRMVQADDIILAVPPTVWNRISFDPPLPTALTPQMGQAIKTLVAVKSRFWRTDKVSPDALCDGPVNRMWDMLTDKESKETCLAAFSSGPSVNKVHEWAPPERQNKILDQLSLPFPMIRQQLVKCDVMDWTADPWTRGGYSFPAPGEVTSIGPILYRGIGRLHFAGEHTCYAFCGFMEGGLYSGASLAKRMATRDRLNR